MTICWRIKTLISLASFLALSAFAQESDEQTDFNVQIPIEPSPTPSPSSEVAEPALETEDSDANSARERSQPVRWGQTMIGISVARPAFPCLVGYQTLYSGAPDAPSFSSELVFWRSLISASVKLQVAYFSDRGHPAKSGVAPAEPCSDVVIEAEPNERTELTIVPIDLSLWFRVPLWSSKPLYFGFGGGSEFLFHTETRLENSGSSTSSTETSDKPFVNQARKSLIIYGGELGIRITPEDISSGGLGVDALNLRSIYLNAFYHLRQRSGDQGMDLSGSTMGLGFNFELF